MASNGQALLQASHRVQRSGLVKTAYLRCPLVSRVISRAEQADTQRPQPEHRFTSITGVWFSGITKQLRLLPLFNHQLFFPGRVVAGAGCNYGRGRLFTTASAAFAELVGNDCFRFFSCFRSYPGGHCSSLPANR